MYMYMYMLVYLFEINPCRCTMWEPWRDMQRWVTALELAKAKAIKNLESGGLVSVSTLILRWATCSTIVWVCACTLGINIEGVGGTQGSPLTEFSPLWKKSYINNPCMCPCDWGSIVGEICTGHLHVHVEEESVKGRRKEGKRES